MTPLDAVRACSQIYGAPPAGFADILSVDGIIAGTMPLPGGVAVVFRGSETLEDWFRDLDAAMVDIPGVGDVHQGFSVGMERFMSDVFPAFTGRIVLAGHSLGAARACILAGMLAPFDISVDELHLFGCPRPGGRELARIVNQNVRHIESYRNGRDPVPLVPDLADLYVPVAEPTAISFQGDPEDPFADHFIANYMRAVAARCATP